ncbi:MAG: alpha-D-ribose 1-methylphosphonate 5-triphosphate diphosphatase [Pseudomonadota bacterium]
MRPIHIESGKVLIDGALSETSITLKGGIIDAIGDGRPRDTLVIDASNLLVLPGIVDIHGDAFERQIMPRPGVRFPHALALLDTDRQLASAGITTAYHGLTLSWEPGLRSIDAASGFLQVLAKERSRLAVDHRVQLRLETFAFEVEDLMIDQFATAPVPALAFNDHTTSTLRKIEEGRAQQLPEWARRAGLSVDDYLERLKNVWARRAEVPAFIERMAAAARDAGIIMLSHDDRTIDERSHYRGIGVAIAEFPITNEAIGDACMNDEPTVLGAPNVVRGGSHTHALNAADMIDAGQCSILASDYHYPSMLAAIGQLVEKRGHAFEDAWRLVSEAPADALGLKDRGKLRRGLRADLVLVTREEGRLPRAIATLAGGRLAFLDGHERLT